MGLPLTVWKQNYVQYRPYLGLSDCRDGILQTVNNKSERQVFNLITNNYKLDHIVELINSVKKVNLNMVDTPLLNQHSYKVDASKIKRLGYHPRSNIYSEIKKTITLFDSVN